MGQVDQVSPRDQIEIFCGKTIFLHMVVFLKKYQNIKKKFKNHKLTRGKILIWHVLVSFSRKKSKKKIKKIKKTTS